MFHKCRPVRDVGMVCGGRSEDENEIGEIEQIGMRRVEIVGLGRCAIVERRRERRD
jgi:hypothetical protein